MAETNNKKWNGLLQQNIGHFACHASEEGQARYTLANLPISPLKILGH
jgi:hypothetical protein